MLKNLFMVLCLAIIAAFTVLAQPGYALAARLEVTIDLSQQKMSVITSKGGQFVWPVSTARKGYRTPIGSFRPVRLEREWYSTKYDYAPMPHSIFFHHGYAIHGTTDLRNLGRPASHGCVRLHPDNARALFNLVRTYGARHTIIRVKK